MGSLSCEALLGIQRLLGYAMTKSLILRDISEKLGCFLAGVYLGMRQPLKNVASVGTSLV